MTTDARRRLSEHPREPHLFAIEKVFSKVDKDALRYYIKPAFNLPLSVSEGGIKTTGASEI